MKRYILFAFAFSLGWLGLVSGQGGACSTCNPEGKQNCNSKGDCICKPGYTDKNCDKCASGNYWKDGKKCLALTIYNDTFTVSDIPLADRCANDGHNIKFKEEDIIYEYENVKDAEECQELCRQWPNCDIWRLKHKNAIAKLCALIRREAFQNQEFTKQRISGYDDCPNSDKCLENDKYYDTKYNLKVIPNVEDPYECQKECEYHQGCSHWTYSFDQGDRDTCYLKNATLGDIVTGTQKKGNKKAVNYVSGAVECNFCFNFHRTYNILPNIEHTGGAASVKADSHYECQEICKADALCQWFEWSSKTKDCYKTNPFYQLTPQDDVVTGLRDCDLACGKCDDLGVLDRKDKTCDAAGNCKCKDNYADSLCTRCRAGFTRDANGTCTPCNCDLHGSKGKVCDTKSGQCPCWPHNIGLQCNRCNQSMVMSNGRCCFKGDYYNLKAGRCEDCYCFPRGSKSCHPFKDDLCRCRLNFLGKRCDDSSEITMHANSKDFSMGGKYFRVFAIECTGDCNILSIRTIGSNVFLYLVASTTLTRHRSQPILYYSQFCNGSTPTGNSAGDADCMDGNVKYSGQPAKKVFVHFYSTSSLGGWGSTKLGVKIPNYYNSYLLSKAQIPIQPNT